MAVVCWVNRVGFGAMRGPARFGIEWMTSMKWIEEVIAEGHGDIKQSR